MGDCTGTNFVEGVTDGIDSGNVNGYKNKKAFNGNPNICWRGLEDNDEAFWIGKTFDTSIEVKCISFLDSDSNGVTEMKVQALNSNGIWINVAEGENLTPGQEQTIEIASPTTPTSSPTTSSPTTSSPTTSSPTTFSPTTSSPTTSSPTTSSPTTSSPTPGQGDCINKDEVL